MRVIRTTALLLAAGVPGVAQAATQGFALTPYDTIRLEAPVKLVVRTGRGVSAQADGDRRAIDRLKLSVNGQILTIRLAAPDLSAQPTSPGLVTLTLTTDQVKRLTLNGSGSVQIDKMAGARGDLVLAGAGSVTVGSVALDRLAVSLSGSGGVKLSGTAKIADIGLAGAGSIDAATLSVGQLSLTAEGTGNATVSASGSANVKAIGAGDVTILGKAACKVAHEGGGRVICGGAER